MSRSRHWSGALLSAAALSLVVGSTSAVADASEFTVSTDSAGQVRQALPLGARAASDTARVTALGKAFRAKGELRSAAVSPNGAGSFVRLQQFVDGVPVYGAQVVQSVGANGVLQSASGATSTATKGSFPANENAAQSRAVRTLVAQFAKEAGVAPEMLRAAKITKQWIAPSFIGGSDTTAVAGYQVEIRGGLGNHWIGFADANSGKVLGTWSLTNDAVNRAVCDANSYVLNGDTQDNKALRCGKQQAFKPVRAEGQGPAKLEDANRVYDFFGQTQNFYAKYTGLADLTAKIGADYGDGLGKALRGTVRLCYTDFDNGKQCPWKNAFWDTEQMAFGEGVTTDDVTAHELTHGVTQHTNGLNYNKQSGAINESMSDVFGELLDLTNGDADDTPANRWKLAEGSSLGAIRDMKDPTKFNQPDKMSSSKWFTGSTDAGGVHTNSGVGNKALYLITDGDTFNGQTIKGIGIEKAAALYWTVENLLTSSSQYPDLGRALSTGCKNNVTNNVAGTTNADCDEVAKVVKATEMTSYPRS